MTFGDSFAMAVRAVMANKLRSALTMLGVVIGVGSVIAMIGIGEGTKQKSLSELEVMGSNRITVMSNWGRRSSSAGDSSTLREVDVERIKSRVPSLKHITGVVQNRGTAKFGAANKQVQVSGAEPQIKYIENSTKMLDGEWFTELDNEMLERKAVLGYNVYDELYGGQNAIGTYVKLNNQNFEVVGVVEYKGGSGFRNPDDAVYIPLKTAQKRMFGTGDRLNFITMQGINSEFLGVIQADVEDTLAAYRKNASGEELFRVFNQAETLAQVESQSRILGFLLAGIASVSLLVGGIGIMNIMLVSVTERTREIGLRKAIGAKRGTILSQFLYESVVMCVMGGMIGMVLGVAATKLVAELLQVPPVVNSTAIILAFGFATAVGLFFGLYPAIRASRLVPIEALRYE